MHKSVTGGEIMILSFWLSCLIDYTRLIEKNDVLMLCQDQLEELYIN